MPSSRPYQTPTNGLLGNALLPRFFLVIVYCPLGRRPMVDKTYVYVLYGTVFFYFLFFLYPVYCPLQSGLYVGHYLLILKGPSALVLP